jgi:hypothetical protein
MQTPGKKNEPPAGEVRDERRARWRPPLRALHRDFGYVAVGLTLIYACSGLAVNHIADWDPNFHDASTTHELGPIAGDDATIARVVEEKLHIEEPPRDVYRASDERLDLVFDKRVVHVNPKTGHVVDEGQKPRLLLRIANWLHLNRGKKAWTYVADAYAAALLFLAISGMFMIAGKKGFFWRGAAFVALGLAIPTVYVIASGGP